MIYKKIFSAFLVFVLGVFPISFAFSNNFYEKKTLFSTITDPSLGEVVPFTMDIEENMLTGKKERTVIDIRGVSQPHAENEIFIMTPIPKKITNFHVQYSLDQLHFSWKPRDSFQLTYSKAGSTSGILKRIRRYVGAKPSVPALHFPSDFLKIIERNETFYLPEKNVPRCHIPHRENTKCRYEEFDMVGSGSEANCIQNGVSAVTGTIDISYNNSSTNENLIRQDCKKTRDAINNIRNYAINFRSHLEEIIVSIQENEKRSNADYDALTLLPQDGGPMDIADDIDSKLDTFLAAAEYSIQDSIIAKKIASQVQPTVDFMELAIEEIYKKSKEIGGNPPGSNNPHKHSEAYELSGGYDTNCNYGSATDLRGRCGEYIQASCDADKETEYICTYTYRGFGNNFTQEISKEKGCRDLQIGGTENCSGIGYVQGIPTSSYVCPSRDKTFTNHNYSQENSNYLGCLNTSTSAEKECIGSCDTKKKQGESKCVSPSACISSRKTSCDNSCPEYVINCVTDEDGVKTCTNNSEARRICFGNCSTTDYATPCNNEYNSCMKKVGDMYLACATDTSVSSSCASVKARSDLSCKSSLVSCQYMANRNNEDPLECNAPERYIEADLYVSGKCNNSTSSDAIKQTSRNNYEKSKNVSQQCSADYINVESTRGVVYDILKNGDNTILDVRNKIQLEATRIQNEQQTKANIKKTELKQMIQEKRTQGNDEENMLANTNNKVRANTSEYQPPNVHYIVPKYTDELIGGIQKKSNAEQLKIITPQNTMSEFHWYQCGKGPWCKISGTPSMYRSCDTTYTCDAWQYGIRDNFPMDMVDTHVGEYDYLLVDPQTKPVEVRSSNIRGIQEYLLEWEEKKTTKNSIHKRNPGHIEFSLPPDWDMMRNLYPEDSIQASLKNLIASQISSSLLASLYRGERNSRPEVPVQVTLPVPSPPPPPTNEPTVRLPESEIPPVAPACAQPQCNPPMCPAPPFRGFNTLEREYILVDDFEKYEIWYNIEGDSEKPYLSHVGVIRDPNVSNRLPLPNEDEWYLNKTPPGTESGALPVARYETDARYPLNSTIHASKKYYEGKKISVSPARIPGYNPATDTIYFALFEVRRIEFSDRGHAEPLNVARPGEKHDVYQPNNQRDKIDVKGAENDEGYLVTAVNEYVLRPGGAGRSINPSPQKIEYELRDVQRVANEEGDFIIEDFSLLRMNPMSDYHTILGLYSSTDTRMSQDSDNNSFYIGTNRSAGFFTTHGNQSVAPPTFSVQNQPYGTVFDEWTREPIPYASVSMSGKGSTLEGSILENTMREMTNADGFFSFFASPGIYDIRILSVNNGEGDTFFFPMRPSACSSALSPYSGIECDIASKKIVVENETIKHIDIPVTPRIYGVVTHWGDKSGKIYLEDSSGKVVQEKRILPNGKFSFFVPTGDYRISKIILDDGAENNIGKNINARGSILQSSPVSVSM